MKVLFSVMITLTFGLSSSAVFAEEAPQGGYTKDFEKKFDIPSMGQVRMYYRNGGEPVSEPARVELWVRCKGQKEEKRVERIEICSLTKFVYEKDVKLLTLSYVYGRVVNSKAVCDANDEREFKLGHFCDKVKRQ